MIEGQGHDVDSKVRIPRAEVEGLVGKVDGRLLKLACEDKVGEVAITYEDPLTRFSQESLEAPFACFGVTLTVLESSESKTQGARADI